MKYNVFIKCIDFFSLAYHQKISSEIENVTIIPLAVHNGKTIILIIVSIGLRFPSVMKKDKLTYFKFKNIPSNQMLELYSYSALISEDSI